MDLTLDRSDTAALDFVEGLRTFAVRDTAAPLRQLYEAERRRSDGEPSSPDEVGGMLDAQPRVRFRWFLQRRAQELMWGGIHAALKPCEAELRARMDEYAQRHEYGRLELDPELKPPEWFTRVDFHIQPGAYYGDDMHAVVYDLGAKIYSLGSGRERRIGDMLAAQLPRHDYRDILDLGSGIGKSSAPLRAAFPEARVTGIDMSAAMVKYAHMLAEEQGLAIDYSQQDAEHLKFAGGSFDLVQAIILFHELPPKSLPKVAAEALRVLRPGGHFVIGDITPWREVDPFAQWISNWQVRNNGEPYWKSTNTANLGQILREVGFSKVTEQSASPTPGEKFPWMTIGEK